MAAQQAEVKCAQCKIALQGPTNPKPQDRFSCPRCGIGDSYQNVMRDVRGHVEEQLGNRITQLMRNATRGSKYLQFTEKPRAKRRYRFIVDAKF